MRIEDLKEHLDKKFEHLENRINQLESAKDFLTGAWKALSIIGGIGVVLIGFYLKLK